MAGNSNDSVGVSKREEYELVVPIACIKQRCGAVTVDILGEQGFVARCGLQQGIVVENGSHAGRRVRADNENIVDVVDHVRQFHVTKHDILLTAHGYQHGVRDVYILDIC